MPCMPCVHSEPLGCTLKLRDPDDRPMTARREHDLSIMRDIRSLRQRLCGLILSDSVARSVESFLLRVRYGKWTRIGVARC